MKIISIEPTPSPNVMKCNLDESLPQGTSYNLNKGSKIGAPVYLQKLLEIDGVTSLFQVLDFISIERHPKADWQDILNQVRGVLGEVTSNQASSLMNGRTEERAQSDGFGEVEVWLQKLKSIPMQVKLVKDGEEYRFGLPDRFKKAVMEAQVVTTNLVFERKWEQQSTRYGEVQDVAEQVVEEISAAYHEERLQQLVHQMLHSNQDQPKKVIQAKDVIEALKHPDWKYRFAILEQFEPTLETIEVLEMALRDPKTGIRRQAVVYLGFLASKEVLPYLYRALKDESAVVRRTAGDTISDLGFSEAIPVMCRALKDKNKLVRWRAARFLYEVGDKQAVPALKEAVNDPEFEVKMQIQMALERIERGEEASGTVWQQMTRRMKEKE